MKWQCQSDEEKYLLPWSLCLAIIKSGSKQKAFSDKEDLEHFSLTDPCSKAMKTYTSVKKIIILGERIGQKNQKWTEKNWKTCWQNLKALNIKNK